MTPGGTQTPKIEMHRKLGKKLEEKREGSPPPPPKIKNNHIHTHTPTQSYLDSFYSKSQGSCWANGLSPLHVSGFGHCLLVLFLSCRRVRINLNHFLIHVRSWRWLLTSLGQLFLKVGPEAWEEKRKKKKHRWWAVKKERRRKGGWETWEVGSMTQLFGKSFIQRYWMQKQQVSLFDSKTRVHSLISY